MSLTKCRECNHDVSTKAATCPHCGVKCSDGWFGGGCLVLGLIVLAVGALVAFWLFDTALETEKRREAGQPTSYRASDSGGMVFVGQKFGTAPNPVALVAEDTAVIVEIGQGLASGDKQPMLRAMEQNRATFVPGGTRGVIVDKKTIGQAEFYQIKISDGELAGKYLWTHSSFVSK